MREADHPADGRLCNGPVDRACGDHHEYVSPRGSAHIDGIVADAESPDGEQIVGRGHRLFRYLRRQYDDAIRACDLIGADLRPVFGTWRQLYLRLPLKDGRTQVGELGLAAWVEEVRRLIDLKLLQNVIGSV